MRDYRPLPSLNLQGTVLVARPAPPKSVKEDSPALDVMTDLRHNIPATIDQQQSMDAAHAYMIQRGVRMLFVLNSERSLCGIITANDILGDKPLRFIQERRVRHSEILVADIMTPLERLDAIDWRTVSHGHVGEVVASLKESGRQHTLVIDKDREGRVVVIGVFSLTQIERQLGVSIIASGAARSFAEIEAAIAPG
ncbi:MAG: CBS domain-containing protein [Betaproteobacteria bacterium]|nr:CBS domain-containing protein [Betaproteobacteria bacterium]